MTNFPNVATELKVHASARAPEHAYLCASITRQPIVDLLDIVSTHNISFSFAVHNYAIIKYDPRYKTAGMPLEA